MIDVLLATYKPREDWLKEQLDSIKCNADQVRIVRREDAEGLGACQNFAALMQQEVEQSKAEYYAFCDQDDVWLPGKLDESLAEMKRLEAKYGQSMPLLVFGDVTVVDEHLNKIADSLLQNINVDPSRSLPRQLVFQNVANGNTILFNRALLEKATPVSKDAFMHDCWVTMVASLYGKMSFLPKPSVLYRQHAKNVIGGRKIGLVHYLRRFQEGAKSIREGGFEYIRQAAAFPEFSYLKDFEYRSWLMRRWLVLRHGLFKNGLVRNIGTMIFI